MPRCAVVVVVVVDRRRSASSTANQRASPAIRGSVSEAPNAQQRRLCHESETPAWLTSASQRNERTNERMNYWTKEGTKEGTYLVPTFLHLHLPTYQPYLPVYISTFLSTQFLVKSPWSGLLCLCYLPIWGTLVKTYLTVIGRVGVLRKGYLLVQAKSSGSQF